MNRSAEEAFGYTLEEMQRLDVGDMTVNEPPYTRREASSTFRRRFWRAPRSSSGWQRAGAES